jgi:hypothetical protein
MCEQERVGEETMTKKKKDKLVVSTGENGGG